MTFTVRDIFFWNTENRDNLVFQITANQANKSWILLLAVLLVIEHPELSVKKKTHTKIRYISMVIKQIKQQ